MNPQEHANMVNERSQLQEKLAAVEQLEKNSPGNHQLAAERNKIMARLQAIDTAVGFHYAAQDQVNPRAQL
jgi:uncharacterized protein YgiM (DUF1202 family)